eukprot:gene5561-4014_t
MKIYARLDIERSSTAGEAGQEALWFPFFCCCFLLGPLFAGCHSSSSFLHLFLISPKAKANDFFHFCPHHTTVASETSIHFVNTPARNLTELDGLQPNGVLHYDFRTPQNAAKKLGASFRIMQWNIERGAKIQGIIDVINYCEPDIIVLQELDVHCRRSGYLNTVKEIAKGVEAEIFFVCEFIEIDSPDRSEHNAVGPMSDTQDNVVPLPPALQRHVDNGGRLRHFHGNAILSRRAHLTDPTVVPHSESINWKTMGAKLHEPRYGCRNFIRVCIPPEERTRPSLPPVHLYSSHFEVFCGLLTRVRQLGDVMSDIKLVQRSYNAWMKTKYGGARRRYPQAAFIVAGDLNSMAHGLVRCSPTYATDRMRLLSIGETEACWIQRKVLSRRMGRRVAKNTSWWTRLYDVIFSGDVVWKLVYGFTESELDIIDNRDTCLYDQADKVTSVTWCGPEYKGFVKGKYDWVLLSNMRAAPFQCCRDGAVPVNVSGLMRHGSVESPQTIAYLERSNEGLPTFREMPADGYLLFNEKFTDSDHRGLLMTVEQHTGSPAEVYPKDGATYTSSIFDRLYFAATRVVLYGTCAWCVRKAIQKHFQQNDTRRAKRRRVSVVFYLRSAGCIPREPMPPLHVWCLGAAAASTASGAAYYGFYIPRVEQEAKAEAAWERERRESQVVWHRLAQLERAAAGTSSNTTRLELFCGVQEARCALLRLLTSTQPAVARSLTHTQATEYLRRLGKLEQVHCGPLRFREMPLRVMEVLRCLVCFAAYLICFRVAPLLCPIAVGPPLRHAAARRIMHLLEIPCTITVEAADSGPSDAPLVLPARHWAEEVGLWACINTPLLRGAALVTSPAVPYADRWAARFDRFPALWPPAAASPPCLGYPLSPVPPDGPDSGLVVARPVGTAGLADICDVSPWGGGPGPAAVQPERERHTTYDCMAEHQFIRGREVPAPAPAAPPQAVDFVPRWAWRYGLCVFGGSSAFRNGRPVRSLHFHVGPPCPFGAGLEEGAIAAWRSAVLTAGKSNAWWAFGTLTITKGGVRAMSRVPPTKLCGSTLFRLSPLVLSVSLDKPVLYRLPLNRYNHAAPPRLPKNGRHAPHHVSPSAEALAGEAPAPQPMLALHPPVKFRARSMRKGFAETLDPTAGGASSPQSLTPAEAADAQLHAGPRITDVDAVVDSTGMNEVQVFLESVDQQTEQARYDRNQAIPFPPHPDSLVPEFRRIKRHQRQEVVAHSPTDDRPVFTRRDAFVRPPPSPSHPWVGPQTPIGPNIVHGDGQINVVGTGEVGFEDSERDGAALDKEAQDARRKWRGLHHRTVVRRPLPTWNATLNQEVVVKHSFSLTGRGVFATKKILKGETIMIASCTARSVGVKGEIERLEEMCVHILQRATEERDLGYLDYLHDWILTGQPSSLLEHWPQAATERVIEAIGGLERLYNLELHPIHIARIASIMDLNSFLVESSYAERKGMAYFPEAGFFNHSCLPNTSYDIMPEHVFEESEYAVDEKARRELDTSNSGGSCAIVATAESARRRAEDRLQALMAGTGTELTEQGAPGYLFCCRADRDIEAGEELLISYVPPEWSFDNRQYVLHDRYRFHCKCPRCAPTIESQYARVPRLLVMLVVFSVFLQLLLMRHRNNAAASFDDEGNYKGNEAEHRMGLFELLEKEQISERNAMDGKVSQRPLASFSSDNHSNTSRCVSVLHCCFAPCPAWATGSLKHLHFFLLPPSLDRFNAPVRQRCTCSHVTAPVAFTVADTLLGALAQCIIHLHCAVMFFHRRRRRRRESSRPAHLPLRGSSAGPEKAAGGHFEQLLVMNVCDAPDILLPTPAAAPSSSLARFYYATWSEALEAAAILGYSPKEAQARSRHTRWRSGQPLPLEMWLSAVPHVVWGSAATLPAPTQLHHVCVSRMHAKLICVTSKSAARYFLETFPLRESAAPPPPPLSLPFYLVVNYAENPLFVNECLIPRGRSAVLGEGDVVSFLESALDAYGGVLTRPAGASDPPGTRVGYCASVEAVLRESLHQSWCGSEPWLAVEESDLLARDGPWHWRQALDVAPQRRLPGPSCPLLWAVPTLPRRVLQCVYQAHADWAACVCPLPPDDDEPLVSPIQERWVVVNTQGTTDSGGRVAFLPAPLPVYVRRSGCLVPPLHAHQLTAQRRRLGLQTANVLYYDEERQDDATHPAEPVWTDLVYHCVLVTNSTNADVLRNGCLFTCSHISSLSLSLRDTNHCLFIVFDALLSLGDDEDVRALANSWTIHPLQRAVASVVEGEGSQHIVASLPRRSSFMSGKEAFVLKPSYCFASGSGRASPERPAADAAYEPSMAECHHLTQPLVKKLSSCTAYDVLGLSTQTRLGSGVLWDPFRKEFVGTLTSTDHLKILLYCNSHPEDTEEVSQWPIAHWLCIRNSYTLLDDDDDRSPSSSSTVPHKPRPASPSSFVSCTTSTTLKECLERMRTHDVHRLVVLSEKESEAFGVVAMVDVQQIVEYLGAALFGKGPAGLGKDGGSDGPVGSASVDESDPHLFGPSRAGLPKLVSTIVSAESDTEVRVGPYTSIFDIPFRCLPMVGVHRHHAIYVTMENTIAEALRLMLDQNIESVAVCTEDRVVTDVISRSDMLRMEQQGVYDTNRTLREAIGGKALRMVYVFDEGDVLWDIFTHFVQKGVRELFLVDPETSQLQGQLNIVEFVYFLAFVGNEANSRLPWAVSNLLKMQMAHVAGRQQFSVLSLEVTFMRRSGWPSVLLRPSCGLSGSQWLLSRNPFTKPRKMQRGSHVVAGTVTHDITDQVRSPGRVSQSGSSMPPLACPGGPRMKSEGIKYLFKVPHAGFLAKYDQRFVLNLKLTHQIAAYIAQTTMKTGDKVVLELGPGPGSLTRSLLARPCVGVLGVESDLRFNPHLQQISNFTDGKFKWVNADVLNASEVELLTGFPRLCGTASAAAATGLLRQRNGSADGPAAQRVASHWWSHGDAKLEVVANLPFSVVSELIIRYAVDCSRHEGIFSFGRVPLHLFTQQEVAERIVAPAGSIHFSRLSVLAQSYFHVCVKQTFSEWTYYPKTEVSGALLTLQPRGVPLSEGIDGGALLHFVDQLMPSGGRGATVHKALMKFAPPEVVQYLLQEARIDGAVIVLDLTVEEIVRLASLWRQFILAINEAAKNGFSVSPLQGCCASPEGLCQLRVSLTFPSTCCGLPLSHFCDLVEVPVNPTGRCATGTRVPAPLSSSTDLSPRMDPELSWNAQALACLDRFHGTASSCSLEAHNQFYEEMTRLLTTAAPISPPTEELQRTVERQVRTIQQLHELLEQAEGVLTAMQMRFSGTSTDTPQGSSGEDPEVLGLVVRRLEQERDEARSQLLAAQQERLEAECAWQEKLRVLMDRMELLEGLAGRSSLHAYRSTLPLHSICRVPPWETNRRVASGHVLMINEHTHVCLWGPVHTQVVVAKPPVIFFFFIRLSLLSFFCAVVLFEFALQFSGRQTAPWRISMDTPTCVLDVGSHTVRAGLGSSTTPEVAVPAIAGSFKYRPIFSALLQNRQESPGSLVVGNRVEAHRGILQLHYPIRCGAVQDWRAGSALLQQALDAVFGRGGVDGAESRPLRVPPTASRCYALVEPPFASRVQRKKIVEQLFEYAERDAVHGVFTGVSPLLALYSTGQLTGVALDLGEGQISTAAAVSGFSIPSAMLRENGAACGGAVTTHLEGLLRTYGACDRVSGTDSPLFSTGSVSDRELVRSIKEQRCEVSPAALPGEGAAAALHQQRPPQPHRLPDGSEVEIGVEAVLAPEVLFAPHLVGSSGSGVADLVACAVAHADLDARPRLLGHLVVSGGTTLMNGFGARFLTEVLQRVPRDNKVRVVAPSERGFAPWLGAALLSQLSTFVSDMVVTKQEYDEAGEPALQQRLFA